MKPTIRPGISAWNRLSWRVLVIAALAVGLTGALSAIADENYKSLAPGVEYRHDVRTSGPLSIHVLRIDRHRQWELQTGLGQGTVFGLERLDGIVGRVAATVKMPALAAINGDFFVIKSGPYRGDPHGLQIAQGELVSRPMGSSFWVTPKGELMIGHVGSKLHVVWPDGKTETPIGLNEARSDNETTLYTPTLGLSPNATPKSPPTTRTKGGKELTLDRVEGKPWLPIQAGRTYSARIVEVRDDGDSPLQKNRLILSCGPNVTMPAAKQGDVLQLVMETSPNLEGVTTAIGGGRILANDDKKIDLGPADQPRHPRSMIGWNDKHLFFIVIDGRQKTSIGMNYPEMSKLAKEYGCAKAIEFDGGGSSTLWAAGKVLNSPSDGHPRSIANGLILLQKGEVPKRQPTP